MTKRQSNPEPPAAEDNGSIPGLLVRVRVMRPDNQVRVYFPHGHVDFTRTNFKRRFRLELDANYDDMKKLVIL